MLRTSDCGKVAHEPTIRKGRVDNADIFSAKQRTALSAIVGRRVQFDKRKSNPHRRDFWAACPFHADKTPSFHVDDASGFYHCFGCGAHGDAVDWLQTVEGLSFRDAVAELEQMAGTAPALRFVSTPKAAADNEESRALKAARILADCRPLPGTPGARYVVEHRGGVLPPGDALRFHPGLWHGWTRTKWPALVGVISDIRDAESVRGVVAVYLRPDGMGKAGVDPPKPVWGALAGGVVRLSPDEAVTDRVNVCEGIETGLRLMALGVAPVWAALTAGNLRALPFLPGPDLAVWADHDASGTGQGAADDLARRWADAGGWAEVHTPAEAGADWADVPGAPHGR